MSLSNQETQRLAMQRLATRDYDGYCDLLHPTDSVYHDPLFGEYTTQSGIRERFVRLQGQEEAGSIAFEVVGEPLYSQMSSSVECVRRFGGEDAPFPPVRFCHVEHYRGGSIVRATNYYYAYPLPVAASAPNSRIASGSAGGRGLMAETTLSQHDDLEHLRAAARIAGIDADDVALPREYDVVANGMRLHALDWGTAGKTPILFLHGGGICARTWDLVCVALRDDYHCLALDQRGHGESEWSPAVEYRPEAHVGDIAGFIDVLGLDRFVLVGQSMGAMNAMMYAGDHPERLDGLVIVDAGPEVRAEGASHIRDFVESTAELESLEEGIAMAVQFNPRRDPALLRRSLLHNFRQLPNGKWARKHDMRQWRELDAQDLVERARALWQDIPRITCPALVVRGAESDVLLDGDATRLAQALPSGRCVTVDDAGHNVQGDNPLGLVQAIRQFAAKLGE